MTDGFSSITPLWRDSSIPNVSKKHIYEYYFFVTLIFSIISLLKIHATAIVNFSNCLGSHPLQSGQRQLLGISRSKYLARTLIDFVGRASSSFFYHIVHEPKKRIDLRISTWCTNETNEVFLPFSLSFSLQCFGWTK